MNREIKFRIWDKEHREILGWDIVEKEGTLEWLSYDLFCVMQYTGLDDKNGVEIYEGDICKVSAKEPYSNDYFTTEYDWEMIMSTDFSYGAFQFREINDKHMSIYYIETQDMDIEVIGNIYEDKSLLKGSKDE